MAAPRQLLELVERFDQNRDAYRSGRYNEAQARIEFIDPMFKLLGWDMNNDAGYAEAYKDVARLIGFCGVQSSALRMRPT